METLRNKLIHHGASVEFIDKICSLRLNASYRYKTEVGGIYEGFFKKVKYGGGDNLTLFSRQTPPVSVQNAEKHLCSSEIRYG